MHLLRLLIAALLLMGFSACEESHPSPLGIDSWMPLQVETVRIQAQIALSRQEQQKGLMYRESLPENSGMLFPYPTPRELSFWMANTPLPLDIGFFDAQGVLREIHRLIPFDVSPVRSHGDNLQFALEMPQGWFASKGLFAGSQMDMDLLRTAIEKRGGDPAAFGL